MVSLAPSSALPYPVSASQVELFAKCERAWWFRYVGRLPSPQTEAQARGTRIHKAVEDKILGKRISVALAPDELRMVDAAIRVLSGRVLNNVNFRAEGEIFIPTYPGGPLWRGFIDLWLPDEVPQSVLDYKTTSDFRYAKTPNELSRTIQMVSYGKWAFAQTAAKSVRLEHLYVRTRGAAKTHAVETSVTREHVETEWLSLMPRVRKLVTLRSCSSSDDMTPNGVDTGQCHAYGGCSYREHCGLSPNSLITIRPTKKADTTMANPSPTIFQKLAALRDKKAGAPAEVATATPTEPAPTPEPSETPMGVVPPDAPPREQEPAPVAAPAVAPVAVAVPNRAVVTAGTPPPAPKKRRGRPPKNPTVETAPEIEVPRPSGNAFTCPACGKWAQIDTKGRLMDHTGEVDGQVCPVSGDTPDEARSWVAQNSETPALPTQSADPTADPSDLGPVDSELSPVVAPATATAIEAIYIDCIPTKGPHKGTYTLLEEWLGPVARMASEANNVADYRLISYTSKGVLATAINLIRQTGGDEESGVGPCPSVLVVNSQTPGADVALECLIPFAKTVIKRL